MDVAESGVRTLGAAAATGSKPLLDIMQPQREFSSRDAGYDDMFLQRLHRIKRIARACCTLIAQVHLLKYDSSSWNRISRWFTGGVIFLFICFLNVYSYCKWETITACGNLHYLLLNGGKGFLLSFKWWVILSCILVSVATVNEYALKGLDKMEATLPILHQPADKVGKLFGILFTRLMG